MTRTFKVTDIDYDTDGEEVELPKEFTIALEVEEEGDFDFDDMLADEISDRTGWCVNSFVSEEVETVEVVTPNYVEAEVGQTITVTPYRNARVGCGWEHYGPDVTLTVKTVEQLPKRGGIAMRFQRITGTRVKAS